MYQSSYVTGKVHKRASSMRFGGAHHCRVGLQANSALMTYVAFLRGVNVGGKGIVSMAAIKEALVALGLSDVRTYINSGNVIFSTRAADAGRLTVGIEKALQQQAGIAIKVL